LSEFADQRARFREFWAEIFQILALSNQGRDREALPLALGVRERFPEQAAETIYSIACLYARTNQPEEALATLEAALNAGVAWHKAVLLRSPSLAPLHDAPRWRTILSRSEDRMREQENSDRPEVLIMPPQQSGSQTPLLMALHGGADRMEEFAPYWQSATGLGILLLVPRSSQRRSSDNFWWGPWWGPQGPFDQERAEADVLTAYDQARREQSFDGHRVVLGGFSQGANMAITLALRQRPFESAGFICVGSGIDDLTALNPLMEPAAARGLRGWMLAGEREESLASVRNLHRELTRSGIACQLDLVPGLGHEFPEDFDIRLAEAIRFIFQDDTLTPT
jgi:predicted esterase